MILKSYRDESKDVYIYHLTPTNIEWATHVGNLGGERCRELPKGLMK